METYLPKLRILAKGGEKVVACTHMRDFWCPRALKMEDRRRKCLILGGAWSRPWREEEGEKILRKSESVVKYEIKEGGRGLEEKEKVKKNCPSLQLPYNCNQVPPSNFHRNCNEEGVNRNGVRSEDKHTGMGERQQEKGLFRIHMNSLLLVPCSSPAMGNT
jgi:hypothetical protein